MRNRVRWVQFSIIQNQQAASVQAIAFQFANDVLQFRKLLQNNRNFLGHTSVADTIVEETG